jgi:hypothetical protein
MAVYTYKYFDPVEDILIGKQKIKTFPIWTDDPSDIDVNPEAILTTFYTSSYELANWEAYYFYNIFGSETSGSYNQPTQFSITVGTKNQYQLNDPDDEDKFTYPSNAIYRQLVNALIDGSDTETGFVINSVTSSYIYALSISRSRIKDGIEPDTWLLHLSGSTDVVLTNATSSNTGLTVYNVIVSGSPTSIVGKFYPEKGAIVLSGELLYASGAILVDPATIYTSSYTPSVGLDDFYMSLVDGAHFQARTTEKIQSTHYYVRVKNYESNYSSNPTWVSGSNSQIIDSLYDDPKTFITTIGLYDGTNDAGRLVAVAKLSRPLLKTNETECLVQVRLDF